MKVKDIYLIQRTGKNKYEVAKFNDDPQPSNIYEVVMEPYNKKAWCECMGFRSMSALPLTDPKCGGHKHIRLVGEYERLKCPILTAFWFDKENIIQHNTFGIPMKQLLNGF